MKQHFRNFLLFLLWRAVARKVAAEKPRVLAVVGSIGKTSTKEAVAQVLIKSGRHVIKTAGNLGTDTGIPLSLLGFEEPPSNAFLWLLVVWRALFPPVTQYDRPPYYVLEYASDKPGDIEFLAKRLLVHLGIITTVAPVHLQAFNSLDDLVEEELAIRHYLGEGGALVANADDPYQKALSTKELPIMWYGLDGSGIEHSVKGFHFIKDGINYQTQVIGRHHLYPLLAAIAVGQVEGVAPELIIEAVAEYQVPPGRGRLLEGKNSVAIIDDTYNSSPEAVKAALRMLTDFANGRRRVAILGRMNELGPAGRNLHVEVAQAAKDVELLILIGEFAEIQRQAALELGMPSGSVISFATPEACLEQIEALLQPNDVVLVKASQNGMRLERIVKLLLNDPKQIHNLVRQSRSWQQQV